MPHAEHSERMGKRDSESSHRVKFSRSRNFRCLCDSERLVLRGSDIHPLQPSFLTGYIMSRFPSARDSPGYPSWCSVAQGCLFAGVIWRKICNY